MEIPPPGYRPIYVETGGPIYREHTRARFEEDIGDQTRVIQSLTIPHARTARRSRPHHSHGYEPPHQSHGYPAPQWAHGAPGAPGASGRLEPPSHGYGVHIDPVNRRARFHTRANLPSDDSNFDPFIPSRGVVPSLTFHFNFDKENPEPLQPIKSGAKTVEKNPPREAKERRVQQFHENVNDVLSSRYIGGIHGQEDSTAELFTNHATSTTDRPDLLTWIQIERQYPNFDSFIDYISQLNILNEEGRRESKQDALSLLHHVRDRNEKPLHMPHGKKGKCLDSDLMTAAVFSNDATSKDSLEKKERNALFLCMPFFCLAPYSDYSPSQPSNFYPVRTLLQSSNISTSKKRDLQQAICGLNYPRKDYLFHVPQIWCLMLGNDVLITCTHTPATDVKRVLKGIKSQPASAEEVQSSQLRISDGGNRIWILAAIECTTWLEFKAHFRELSLDFEDDYDVIFGRTTLDANNWSAVVERAKKVTVELTLHYKNSVVPDSDASDTSDSTDSEETTDIRVSRSDASKLHFSSATDAQANPLQPMIATNRKSVLREVSGNSFNPSDPNLATSHLRAVKDKSKSPKRFHSFLWLAATQYRPSASQGIDRNARNSTQNTSDEARSMKSGGFFVDWARVEDSLTDMHSYLCTSQFKKSREYKRCPSSTMGEVDTIIEQLKQEVPEPKKKDSRHRSRASSHDDSDDSESGIKSREQIRDEIQSLEHERRMREKKKLVRISKTLFEFFLPLEFSSEMISKYWGAVQLLLQDEKKLSKCMRSFESADVNDVKGFGRIVSALSPSEAPSPHQLALPHGWIEAWPHLVMFFTLSTVKQYSEATYELIKFRQLVHGGWADLLKTLAPQSIHRQEAVLPLGITSLVIRNLLEDVTLGLPDIASIYSESLDKLIQDLSSNPYSRVHQDKIVTFQQEVKCASDVLNTQLDCVNKLLQYIRQDKKNPPRSFQQEREDYILQNCMFVIEAKIRNFEDMNDEAARQASRNITRIESNKDRQEAAILVFTTVTVIFLPLSFVTSFFGMNTSDLRNMSQEQWIFWASAIPVTVVVIGLSLFAIRYFELARQALGQLFHRQDPELETFAAPVQPVYNEPGYPPPPYPQGYVNPPGQSHPPNVMIEERNPSDFYRDGGPRHRSSHAVRY